MKEITTSWLKGWRTTGFVLLGFPTLGFTWVFALNRWNGGWVQRDCWELSAVESLESWLHFWRGVLLLIGGFLTLGYTWSVMCRLNEPCLTGLRTKYGKRRLTNENQ